MRSVPANISPMIKIVAERSEDIRDTNNALDKLVSKKHGRALINEIINSTGPDNKLTIHPNINTLNLAKGSFSYALKAQLSTRGMPPERMSSMAATEVAKSRSIGGMGMGVNADVYWNPVKYLSIKKDGSHEHVIDSGKSFVSLSHELIHALYLIKGDNLAGAYLLSPNGNELRMNEEHRAVGINGFEDTPYSENKIRKEHDLPLRVSY